MIESERRRAAGPWWPALANLLECARGRLSRAGTLAVGVLLLGAPAFGEGPGELFSPGGINCPVSDVDLDTKPAPPASDFVSTTPIDPVYLDWPVTAQPTQIVPLGVDSSLRYFNFNNALTVMVGVSSDMACNLDFGNGSEICTFNAEKPSYYKKVLSDAKKRGLNKIRLLVAYNGLEPEPAEGVCYIPPVADNYPFEYVPGPENTLGYWRLDHPNGQFFTNLREVVVEARKKGIFVEVTFFAPWFGVWEYGPWNINYGRVGDNLEHVGFTSRSDFVKIAPSGDSAALARVRQVQKNVIHWTIDALWDQPRIYWEIANEPENPNPGSVEDCDPTKPPAVDAAAIRSWQEMMINEAVDYETRTYVTSNRARKLKRPHLIAVQPFSSAGVSHYVNNPKVSVINGHYTRAASGAANLGAIDLVRRADTSGRVIGFNEGKISGIDDNQGTAQGGKADSARAEAWEFALNRGAAYDHFGYYYSSDNGVAVRAQLGKLRSFLAALPLSQLAAVPDEARPGWIDLEKYSQSRASPTFKYWAALEPKPNATGVRTYVAYIHHSRTRQAGFDGYDPIMKTNPPYYGAGETYRLCFGPTAGTYEVDWICPEKNERTGGQTIHWTGSACQRIPFPGTEDWTGWMTIQIPSWPGGSAPGCHYTYDIALRIRKTG